MANSSGGDASMRRSNNIRQPSLIRGDDIVDPDEMARREKQACIERNRARPDEQRANGEAGFRRCRCGGC